MISMQYNARNISMSYGIKITPKYLTRRRKLKDVCGVIWIDFKKKSYSIQI